MPPHWARRRERLRLGEPSGESSRPCLVHLVWAPLGVKPLREFAEALRSHPPGIDHELVLAMNGFASAAEARPFLDEVADLEPEVLLFPGRGFDMGVYLDTAARLRRERYCFVNSYGRPLVDGWLAKLDAALDLPGVGQVGATGAWASGHSWLLYSAGLPSAYRGLMPPPRVARRLARGIDSELGAPGPGSTADVLRARLDLVRGVPRTLLRYPPFPSRFIRTNSFMVTHAALKELRLYVVHSKTDTYALEGSRTSITRQLHRLGLSSLVVDRAGAVYEPEDWHRSRTLWQGDQEGLLVADNRTLSYTNGDFARRQLLSTLAWGPFADPRLPREEPATIGAV
jgi:hypothetical protein